MIAKNSSRLYNVMHNSMWATLSQIIVLVLGLVSRKIFLDYLGAELLGVNSLFSDVLLLFSFADLGFGTAIMFSMYKPIAVNDHNKVKSFLLFYRKIYRYVIIAITLLSILFIPLLSKIKTDIPLSDLRLYYILFQVNNIIQYMWVYRENYVIASQRERILSIINIIFSILTTLGLLILIVIYKNFLLYLVATVLFTLIKKILLNFYLIRKFPITILKHTEELSKDETKSVIKKSMALLVTKIGNLLINQTDSLIVSYIIGVIQWGYASNYLVLKKAVFIITDKIYSAVLPSMGNLVAENKKDKELSIFLRYDFFNAWIHTFFFISLTCLSTPFISLFFGAKTILPTTFVFIFFLSAFFDGLRAPISILRESTGTYEADKWYTILAAVINLIVSIPLAKILGLSGVFIGTILAMITLHICRTYVLFYKNDYGIKYYQYLCIVFKHILTGIILLFITYHICSCIDLVIHNDYISFIITAVMTTILPNLLWMIIYRNNQDIRSIIKYTKKYFTMY